jgi:signal transduction histidine kinase
MDRHVKDQRGRVLAIRRFNEIGWERHGATRFASVACIPLIVAVIVGPWWGLFGLAFAAVGAAIDWNTVRWLGRLNHELDVLPLAGVRRVQAQLIWRVVALVTAYAVPYVALAFAPGPGPLVGLMFAIGSLVVMTSQHVMTRSMIFYTLPPMALALLMNAWTLGQGFGGALGIELLAAFSLLNAVVMARAGAVAFEDTVAARLKAESAAEDLERRVEERTAELLEAMRTAEAANKAKSLFLANMSHELRTPLNAVIGYSEIIEEDLAAGDVGECPRHIGRVRASALHLLGLIADILDLAKVEAEKVVLRAEDIDTRALARTALDVIAPTAAANSTVCDLVVEPGAERLHADPLRVNQCLMNLLSNAAKFTHGGRILVHVRRTAWKDAAAIAFDVSDTGIGISPQAQERLFQPFVQANASITREYGGTGLGLSITRRYARLMGGDVTLISVPERGSRFTLTLPMSAADAAKASAAA